MEKRKAVTIRDIAKQANVSYQAVSLVINNKPGVSDDTRKRILRLMAELDYHPNRAAQMLTTNRSKTLELLIVGVSHRGGLADSAKNMAHTARQGGYSLLITDTEAEDLPAAFEAAAARLIDGIVVYAPRLNISDEALLEMSNGIPIVRRDYVPGSKLAWVGFDQVYATRMATEYLIGLGHRQIAAIPPRDDIINGYWRYTTWKNVLLEHGLEPGPYYPGDYSIPSGYEAAKRVLATGQPFTALLAGTDRMAMGALRALREHGIHVPDDVSVMGFDNSDLSAYTDPALTTVEFKFHKQDELAVKYLIDLISDPKMELHQRVLLPDFVMRESCRSLTGD